MLRHDLIGVVGPRGATTGEGSEGDDRRDREVRTLPIPTASPS
jgi:hypothetical protein